jgi:hypothetical protein
MTTYHTICLTPEIVKTINEAGWTVEEYCAVMRKSFYSAVDFGSMPVLPEPDFSLEEIEKAQEVMNGVPARDRT